MRSVADPRKKRHPSNRSNALPPFSYGTVWLSPSERPHSEIAVGRHPSEPRYRAVDFTSLFARLRRMLAFRPLVSKNAILRAYNPNRPDSESAFRRLRKAKVVSEGITIKPRRGGRQRG